MSFNQRDKVRSERNLAKRAKRKKTGSIANLRRCANRVPPTRISPTTDSVIRNEP